MSLELCRQVTAEHPELVRTNLGSSCYQHTVFLIAKLRAAGRQAFHVCKSPGEGQFTPPGFTPRTVTGLDGKPYPCSGVSHDAIWCDGQQFDTLAKANDSESPIFEPDGSPMVAIPVWNAIAPEHWRNNNPPLKDDTPTPQPTPQPQPIQLPDRGEMMRAGQNLHAYYRSHEGLQRPDGLWKPETPSSIAQPDWEGIGAWLFDVYLKARVAGKNATDAFNEVIKAIRQTDEWKAKHPGEQP